MPGSAMKGPAFLHIAYLPGEPLAWILPVNTRLRDSSDARLRKRFEEWQGGPLTELSFAVTTKLAILPLVIDHLNDVISGLNAEIRTIEDLQYLVDGGYALNPKDKSLPYALVVAIDSFIYEYRSTYGIRPEFCGKWETA